MQPNVTSIDKPNMLSLKEVATLLVKQFGYHEGLFEVSIELQIGIGPVGPSPDSRFPGAAIAVSGVGLSKAKQPGPHIVDAAEVNPAPVLDEPKATKKPAVTKRPLKKAIK